jgi:hypothetical protein
LQILVLPLIDLVHYPDAQLNGVGFTGTIRMQFRFPLSLTTPLAHLVHKLWSTLDNGAFPQQERQNI